MRLRMAGIPTEEEMAALEESAKIEGQKMLVMFEGVKVQFKEYERLTFIKQSHYLYQRTQNPLFVWDVYRTCQAWGRPVPGWVTEYLMESACTLLTFAAEGWPEGARPVDFIPQALGLSEGQGARSIFSQYNDYNKKLMIYLTVKSVDQELASGEIIQGRGDDRFSIAGDRLSLSGDHIKKIFYNEKRAIEGLGCEM